MLLTEHDRVSCVVSRDDDKHSSSHGPASSVRAQAVIIARLPGRKSPPDDVIDAHTLALARQYHVGRYYRFGRRSVVIWRDAPEGDISPWASVNRLIASKQLRVSRAGVVTLGIEASPIESND